MGACVGLTFALRAPGPVGGSVLACAVAAVVAGELLSPAALRRLLPPPAAPVAPPAALEPAP
jgi:hypothetical protein